MDFDEILSEDEEDCLHILLTGGLSEEADDQDETFEPSNSLQIGHPPSQTSSQALSQTTDSSAFQDSLAEDIYWRDQNDIDEGMRDSWLFSFRPCLPPGIQLIFLLDRQSEYSKSQLIFFLLFLTQEIMLEICIATNHHTEALISKGQNLSYANSMGEWTRVTVEEMYRFVGILIYMTVVNLQTLERYWSTCPLYNNNMVSAVMSITRFKAIFFIRPELTLIKLTETKSGGAYAIPPASASGPG